MALVAAVAGTALEMESEGGALRELVVGAVGGALVGLAGGWLLAQARARGWGSATTHSSAVAALAVGAFAALDQLGGNGFIAAFVAGLAYGAITRRAPDAALHFTHHVGGVLSMLVWFLFGAVMLPRIGQEVIVDFLDGDPDRPIITGRVYNGENMPPFSLPAGKTRRGNTTKTYKGAGHNEMSMDDSPGKEQLRMNAQYDMNSNVNNDQTLNVGNNQSEVVGVNRTRKVGSNETVDVGADQQITISGDQMLQVGANQTVAVGSKIVIDAGTSITLKCGASMIHMNQAGVITISGTLISVAAAINANVAAPITNISGAMLLTQTGMVNLTAGVVTRMDAAATAVVNSGGKAAMTAGGESIVQGAVVKLN
jgi:hypothetical protein